MPLRYKTKTLGELQQEKANREDWKDLTGPTELSTELWRSAYTRGLRDGIHLAREIMSREGKTDD